MADETKWIYARIGFSCEVAFFMEDFKAILYEDEIYCYESILNYPWVKESHMICRSHPNMNTSEHQMMLEEAMKVVSREEGRGEKTVPFALKLCTIEDGQDKAVLKDINWKDLPKVVYITFPVRQVKEGTCLMHKGIQHEVYRQYN